LRIKFIVALLVLVFAPIANAKDVSVQQAAYNNALQKLEKTEAESKADAQAVADTEKLIEKKKKQLADEQKKAELSWKNYLDAKEKVDQTQTALDKAWKE